MTPTLVGRLLAPAASLAVLAAQPAVLCGLACLAAHSPAHSLAHRHHGAAEAPCGGGVTAAHDDATAGLQPVGSALP
ncbi:MAG TPA: hypothetical protein VNI61_06320, partial [Gemmatimonadales bacterium]|nr:hypothetical protein [Gemmatimonadales bacterium]